MTISAVICPCDLLDIVSLKRLLECVGASIRQMSRQVSRGSAGEYQAYERAVSCGSVAEYQIGRAHV